MKGGSNLKEKLLCVMTR